MITADEVRRLIIDHDAARPRSQQTAIGPSDLSSPCSRKLVYHLTGVERVAQQHVNLYAYVGTALHAWLEKALRKDNERQGREVWLIEKRVSVPVTDSVTVTGSNDAYNIDWKCPVDWKTYGANKPGRTKRDAHHGQLDWYALGLILAGHEVTHKAVVYIPRNGTLSDIHVDVRPFDHSAAEASLRRYEQLLSVAAAGPAVLPLVPIADDCTYCPWWVPGWPGDLTEACPGAQATPKTPGDVPAEINTTTTATTTETRTAS